MSGDLSVFLVFMLSMGIPLAVALRQSIPRGVRVAAALSALVILPVEAPALRRMADAPWLAGLSTGSVILFPAPDADEPPDPMSDTAFQVTLAPVEPGPDAHPCLRLCMPRNSTSSGRGFPAP